MAFQVKKAKREKIYTKLALLAPSGGGKTYGALRLATGMAEEIEKETEKQHMYRRTPYGWSPRSLGSNGYETRTIW